MAGEPMEHRRGFVSPFSGPCPTEPPRPQNTAVISPPPGAVLTLADEAAAALVPEPIPDPGAFGALVSANFPELDTTPTRALPHHDDISKFAYYLLYA